MRLPYLGEIVLYTFKRPDEVELSYPAIVTGFESKGVNLVVFTDHRANSEIGFPTSVPYSSDATPGTYCFQNATQGADDAEVAPQESLPEKPKRRAAAKRK